MTKYGYLMAIAIVLASWTPLEAQHKGMCDLVSKETVSKIIGANVTDANDYPGGGDLHATGVSRWCAYMVMPQYHIDAKHGARIDIAPTYPTMTAELYKTTYARSAAPSGGFIDILGRPAYFLIAEYNAALMVRLLLPGDKEELIVSLGNGEKYDTSMKIFNDQAMKDAVIEIAKTFVKNLPAPSSPAPK